jgi:hypothetical protein
MKFRFNESEVTDDAESRLARLCDPNPLCKRQADPAFLSFMPVAIIASSIGAPSFNSTSWDCQDRAARYGQPSDFLT